MMLLLVMLPFSRSASLASMVIPETLFIVHLLLLIINCQAEPSNAGYETCLWTQMRAAPVRDALYIDGGARFVSAPSNVPSLSALNVLSIINFTIPFEINQENLSELFTAVSLGTDITHPQYYSGFMFTDEIEIYTYGGLLSPLASRPEPDSYVFGYQVYEASAGVVTPSLGPFPITLPSSVTNYITDGAGVSVPSEKVAFYFGGMTAPNATLFNFGEAQVPSNFLIQMDMRVEGALNASMKKLPAEVISRADGQLLWLPVSRRGLLVVLGGVVNPEQLFDDSLNASQVTESERISPSFMSTIHLYDIASDAWYSQDIVSAEMPGQLSGFCAVVASEDSTSSYDIFVYGGYNGISGPSVSTAPPSNDVWVLSVPSFTWTKVSEGSETSGRYFHSCVTPYPEQMWVIGGTGIYGDTCLASLIKIFNLNSLIWQDTYDPSNYSHSGYMRPAQILQTINDAESSGAIVNGTPKSMDTKLRTLFTSRYDGKITVYYPYTSTVLKVESFIKQTFSSWFGGILGIVTYLLLSTICMTVIIVTRRRMLLRRCGAAPLLSPDARRSRLVRWINNMQLETEGKEVDGDTEEYKSSKLEGAPPKRRRGLVGNFFSKHRKADSNRERLLRGQDDKSSSHGEVYELKSRRLDGAGYIHIPINQKGESPPTPP